MKKTLLCLCLTLAVLAAHANETIMLLDFRNSQSHNWRGNYHVASLTPTAEGICAVSTGNEDPWIEGPALPVLPQSDYDVLEVELCVKGIATPSCELFWGTPRFKASQSMRFAVSKENEWTVAKIFLPKLEPGTRFRIDPSGGNSTLTVAWIKATPLKAHTPVKGIQAKMVDLGANPVEMKSGTLTLRHNSTRWDAFTVSNGDTLMATGHSHPELALVLQNELSKIDLGKGALAAKATADGLAVTLTVKDAGGATWTLNRTFTAKADNAVEVVTTYRVDQDRLVANMSWLTLFPGLGSYGQAKNQALLPGVEYLGDEESSSERDVRGPNANRLSVDDIKLCFPMMSVAAQGKWLSLSWEHEKYPATIFDMPDRLLKSGANLWGLWWPGVRQGRMDGDLGTYKPITMKAGQTYSLRSLISTGKGDTIIESVKDYVKRNPLPELPKLDGDLQDVISLLAAGYLDSDSYVDGAWRHAVVPNPEKFKPQQTGDVLLYMEWLALNTKDQKLAKRLRDVLADVMPRYKTPGRRTTSLAHYGSSIHQALYFKEIDPWLAAASKWLPGALNRARKDGTVKYRAHGEIDYGVTHWTDHANGLTGNVFLNSTQYMLAAQNDAQRKDYLQWVDTMLETYKNDVPRGAQTWEMPLHTPDILASAYMLRHCVVAYQITGDKKYLAHADYWAWTGVPLIYLVDPSIGYGPTGIYATIAVLGSTRWIAPFWIGQPVQWCGMVYRNVLHNYADILGDKQQADFWNKIANGITLAGLRMVFKEGNLIGLLPDFFLIKTQVSAGPAITPGTTIRAMQRAFNMTDLMGQKATKPGTVVTALGTIDVLSQNSVKLQLWPAHTTQVIVSGVAAKPANVTWNGKPLASRWIEKEKMLVVELLGTGVLSF